MNSVEYKNSVKEKMVKILDSLLTNKIHPLEGIRELLKLRHEVDLSNDELFIPLIGISSETDEFPIGETRKNYDKKMLDKYDRELKEYIAESSDNITKTCSLLKDRIEALRF